MSLLLYNLYTIQQAHVPLLYNLYTIQQAHVPLLYNLLHHSKPCHGYL